MAEEPSCKLWIGKV